MSAKKISPFSSPLRSKYNGTPSKNTYQDERISKESLALGLALWAESKPDSFKQRQEQMKTESMYTQTPCEVWDNVYPTEDTGAVLADDNNFFLSIEGSGYTHAADTICSRFGRECRGKTLYMTKKPCTICLKKIVQMEFSRIVVALHKEGQVFGQATEKSELMPYKPEKKQVDDSTLHSTILLPSKTAYSRLYHDNRVLTMVNELEHGLEQLKNASDQEREDYWLMGLAVLASSRSEDIDVKVGAVLAQRVDDSIFVHGTAYNGVKAKALENDYMQENASKGSYAIHAEQNALLFRPSSVTLLNQCVLYSTHSPCYQCSCMIKQQQILETQYCLVYRGAVHLKAKVKRLQNETVPHQHQSSPPTSQASNPF